MRRLDLIESLNPGASEAELSALEESLGHPLPAVYRQWLGLLRTLTLGDALHFQEQHPFLPNPEHGALPIAGMLCFAELWLEADGDQVLFDLRSGVVDDPPVLYYAHEAEKPGVRRIAPSFTAWLESIPRSPALRE